MFFAKKSNAPAWIAVFLGNPGARYDNTRHNAGFMAADIFAESAGVKISRLKFGALTATAALGGRPALIMKPQTFMNLSGGPVWQAMAFYKIPLERVIVVADDAALPAGKLRVKRRGSAGGHNGLKDIIAKCGGEGFPRIKIGVGGPPHGGYDMADWVLAKLSGEDAKLIYDAAGRAALALEAIASLGVDAAMVKFN